MLPSYLFRFRPFAQTPQFDALFHLFEKGQWRLNQKGARGRSLLHWAAIENREKAVAKLLSFQADVHGRCQLGLTAADYAELLGYSGCSALLKKQKASTIRVYRHQDRAFHTMCKESFAAKIGAKYLDTLVFEHPADLDWAIKKSQRCLRKTTLRQMNRWILSLYEEPFGVCSTKNLYVKWIDAYLGYGVFAAKTIPALTFIGEYAGVVKRRTRKNARHNDYIFGYMIGPKDSPLIIDAKNQGNITRLINHSLTPNLLSRWAIIQGVTRIVFFSKQLIPKGTQLTYDYGDYYWKKRSDPLVICG